MLETASPEIMTQDLRLPAAAGRTILPEGELSVDHRQTRRADQDPIVKSDDQVPIDKKEVAVLLPDDTSSFRYPGGKGGAGVYQTLINNIPPHDIYIETHLGGRRCHAT